MATLNKPKIFIEKNSFVIYSWKDKTENSFQVDYISNKSSEYKGSFQTLNKAILYIEERIIQKKKMYQLENHIELLKQQINFSKTNILSTKDISKKLRKNSFIEWIKNITYNFKQVKQYIN